MYFVIQVSWSRLPPRRYHHECSDVTETHRPAKAVAVWRSSSVDELILQFTATPTSADISEVRGFVHKTAKPLRRTDASERICSANARRQKKKIRTEIRLVRFKFERRVNWRPTNFRHQRTSILRVALSRSVLDGLCQHYRRLCRPLPNVQPADDNILSGNNGVA